MTPEGRAGRRPSLVVVGDVNLDVVAAGRDVVPRFGQEEQLVDRVELFIGGSGGITAVAAASLSIDTRLVAAVGDDELGRQLAAGLEARGVGCGHLIVDRSRPTGCSVILSTPEDRAILTGPGSIVALEASHLTLAALDAVDHLHVSGYFLSSGLQCGLGEVLASVRSRGVTTSLDTNWDPSGRFDAGLAEVMAEIDVLLVNEREALQLGRALVSYAGVDITEAARSLGALVHTVVVKRGIAGAIAWDGEVSHRCGAPGAEVVDTIGAGDAFDAGFLAASLRGLEPSASLAIGCACGAASTEGPGGTSSLLSWPAALAAAGAGRASRAAAGAAASDAAAGDAASGGGRG